MDRNEVLEIIQKEIDISTNLKEGAAEEGKGIMVSMWNAGIEKWQSVYDFIYTLPEPQSTMTKERTMNKGEVIKALKEAWGRSPLEKQEAIDVALDFLKSYPTYGAEVDWFSEAATQYKIAHEAGDNSFAQAAAAIAQAQAAERQAVAMEELAKTVKSIYKHGIG